MIITICVHNCRVRIKGKDPGPHLVAIGYMPSGEELIKSKILAGHAPSVQDAAIADVVAWLQEHRPGWDITTAPPDKDVVTIDSGQQPPNLRPRHTLRDCEKRLLIQRPGHAQAQDGEIWTCTCGKGFEHVCNEAEGCRWDLLP